MFGYNDGKRGTVAAIVPQFFSTDLSKTLSFYARFLGFETQFEYGDPPYYAGAIRDGLSIFFRHVETAPPQPNNKYEEELLDAYLRVANIKALHRELSQRGTVFFRDYAAQPWGFTEFVIRDSDGRLLCFGQASDLVVDDEDAS